MNEVRIIRLLVLILASRRMIHVIIPIIGTAMKKISVPQAKTFCHPSVNT
jgi:hypothetical protein